jgi:hypothetical protein
VDHAPQGQAVTVTSRAMREGPVGMAAGSTGRDGVVLGMGRVLAGVVSRGRVAGVTAARRLLWVMRFQPVAQVGEGAGAGGADASDGHVEACADLGVAGRVGFEEDFDEAAFAGGELGDRGVEGFGAACGSEPVDAVDRVGVGNVGVGVGVGLFTEGALSCPEGLAGGGGGDPSGEPLGVAHLAGVLEQPQPGVLHEVGGVVRVEVLSAGSARDQGLVTGDDRGPGVGFSRSQSPQIRGGGVGPRPSVITRTWLQSGACGGLGGERHAARSRRARLHGGAEPVSGWYQRR